LPLFGYEGDWKCRSNGARFPPQQNLRPYQTSVEYVPPNPPLDFQDAQQIASGLGTNWEQLTEVNEQ
jgi:hypothetical protein